MEKLTRDLIESHLMSCINIHSQEQNDGITRYAWELSTMAVPAGRHEVEEREFSFEFKSFESARNFSFGWIRKNRPDLERAAKTEAIDGIRYRASKAK